MCVVVGALVLVAVVGGALRARSQSVGYERAIDRSYAVQARPLAEESNRLGTQLHELLARMPHDGRTTLEEVLDTLVRSTASLAGAASTAASPAPSGGAGDDVTAAMVDRADAMRILRTAIDRLLGMAPLPVVGATDPSSLPATTRPISEEGAAAQLARVGTLLVRGDRMYAAGRRALRAAPGRGVLPTSVWSRRRSEWSSGRTLSLVDALTSSATLAAVHEVGLVAHSLALTPAPVPSASNGSSVPGVLVLPPTGRVLVGLVVANDGNVAERRIGVRATVARAGRAAHRQRSRVVALTAHSSVSVTLPPVRVVPGDTYTVTVSVDPSVANASGTVTSDTVLLRVATPAPPIVTELLPVRGPGKGGTDVVVLGYGFTWVSSVTFGTAVARFEVVSSTRITAVAPPGKGTVDVRVRNPGGASARSAADRYVYAHEQ